MVDIWDVVTGDYPENPEKTEDNNSNPYHNDIKTEYRGPQASKFPDDLPPPMHPPNRAEYTATDMSRPITDQTPLLAKMINRLNPLDWFPGYGTYISMAAAVALTAIDTLGYPINPTLYGIIAAFGGARIRRAISRPMPSGRF